MSNDARSMTQIADAAVGDVLARVAQTIRRDDLVVYADASGDQNPIHQDEAFARSVGLPDVIAHGMFTFGLVASCIEAVAGGPEGVHDLATRFAAPVVVPAGEEGVEVEIAISLKSRDDDARKAVVDAEVTVAGTKVLNRTRATIAF